MVLPTIYSLISTGWSKLWGRSSRRLKLSSAFRQIFPHSWLNALPTALRVGAPRFYTPSQDRQNVVGNGGVRGRGRCDPLQGSTSNNTGVGTNTPGTAKTPHVVSGLHPTQGESPKQLAL